MAAEDFTGNMGQMQWQQFPWRPAISMEQHGCSGCIADSANVVPSPPSPPSTMRSPCAEEFADCECPSQTSTPSLCETCRIMDVFCRCHVTVDGIHAYKQTCDNCNYKHDSVLPVSNQRGITAGLRFCGRLCRKEFVHACGGERKARLMGTISRSVTKLKRANVETVRRGSSLERRREAAAEARMPDPTGLDTRVRFSSYVEYVDLFDGVAHVVAAERSASAPPSTSGTASSTDSTATSC